MTGVFFHEKRDPLVCPGRDAHEFTGLRMFDDGLGGETVCKHCGVGAVEHTMALDDFAEPRPGDHTTDAQED